MKQMLKLAIGLSVVLMLTGVSFAGISAIAVDVDINPQSCPNPFNLGSKGILPVAILGTLDFDVSQIDCETVELAGAGALRCSLEDVATAYINGNECSCNTEGPDGILDLTLKFD